MSSLLILNESKERCPRQFLEDWVARVRRDLGKRLNTRQKKQLALSLTLVLLDEKSARAINREYRGRDYATDVLSFEAPEALGELVLCLPVIRRQALEHGLSFREELGYMVLHGMLHLLGFDHEQSKAGATRMFRLQDEVFARLAPRS